MLKRLDNSLQFGTIVTAYLQRQLQQAWDATAAALLTSSQWEQSCKEAQISLRESKRASENIRLMMGAYGCTQLWAPTYTQYCLIALYWHNVAHL